MEEAENSDLDVSTLRNYKWGSWKDLEFKRHLHSRAKNTFRFTLKYDNDFEYTAEPWSRKKQILVPAAKIVLTPIPLIKLLGKPVGMSKMRGDTNLHVRTIGDDRSVKFTIEHQEPQTINTGRYSNSVDKYTEKRLPIRIKCKDGSVPIEKVYPNYEEHNQAFNRVLANDLINYILDNPELITIPEIKMRSNYYNDEY